MQANAVSLTETAQCPECGRWMTQCNLRRHYRDQHMPNQAVSCPHCGKWFRNLSSMQSHKSKYHRPDRASPSAAVASASTVGSGAALAGALTLSPSPVRGWGSRPWTPPYPLAALASPGTTTWPRLPAGLTLEHVPPAVQLPQQQHDDEHSIHRLSRS